MSIQRNPDRSAIPFEEERGGAELEAIEWQFERSARSRWKCQRAQIDLAVAEIDFDFGAGDTERLDAAAQEGARAIVHADRADPSAV